MPVSPWAMGKGGGRAPNEVKGANLARRLGLGTRSSHRVHEESSMFWVGFIAVLLGILGGLVMFA